MSFTSLLVNKVSVYRPTTTYTKGVPSKDYPSTATAKNVKCNIQAGSQYGIMGQGALVPKIHGYETEELYVVFFEYGSNVQKDDKVIDEKGRTFIVKTMPEDVSGRAHHVEALLGLEE